MYHSHLTILITLRIRLTYKCVTQELVHLSEDMLGNPDWFLRLNEDISSAVQTFTCRLLWYHFSTRWWRSLLGNNLTRAFLYLKCLQQNNKRDWGWFCWNFTCCINFAFIAAIGWVLSVFKHMILKSAIKMPGKKRMWIWILRLKQDHFSVVSHMIELSSH